MKSKNGKPMNLPAKKARRVGPVKIHIDPAEVEELAARGLTQQQICDSLGISDQTLLNRKKEDLELLEAIKRGKARGISKVVNALFQQALDGNTSAAIFWLKNQAGWRDKIDIEVENNLPAPLVIEVPYIDVEAEPLPTLASKPTE